MGRQDVKDMYIDNKIVYTVTTYFLMKVGINPSMRYQPVITGICSITLPLLLPPSPNSDYSPPVPGSVALPLIVSPCLSPLLFPRLGQCLGLLSKTNLMAYIFL